jgi:hypothetical protein
MVDCFASFTDPSDTNPGVHPGDTIVIDGGGIVDEYDETVSADTDGACGAGAVTLTINDAVVGRAYEVALSGYGTLVKLSDTVWCWTPHYYPSPPSDEEERDNSSVDVDINGNLLYRYLPHFCCRNGMSISGPTSVEPDSETEYTIVYTDPWSECEYDWSATDGYIVGGTFIAPSTPGVVTISVTPFLADDMGETCATLDVTVESPCGGESIGYTTLQMSTSGSQTLTVVNPVTGKTYGWSASSGSIDATGLSVTYTAPSSNANCSSNPTITLTCGGNVVDSIGIAINGTEGYGVGYLCEITNPGSCRIGYYPPGVIYKYVWEGFTYTRWALQCNGTVTTSGYGGPINMTTYASSGGSCAASYAYILTHTSDCLCLTEEGFNGLWGDCRSVAEKANGCCPSQLMGATRTCRYC